MEASIRKVSEEEYQRRETFGDSDSLDKRLRDLIIPLENRGYAMISRAPNNKEPLILIPNRRVIDHDWDPRSLDSLSPGLSSNNPSDVEINDGIVYAGIVYLPYLEKHGLLPEFLKHHKV